MTTPINLALGLDGTEEAADGTEALVDKLETLEKQLGESSKKVDELGGKLREATGKKTDFEKAATKAVGALGSFATAIKAATHAAGAQNTELGKAVGKFADVASAAGAGAAAFGPWGAAIFGGIAAITALSSSLEENVVDLDEWSAALDRSVQRLLEANRLEALASAQLGTAAQARDAENEAIARTRVLFGQLNAARVAEMNAVRELEEAEQSLTSGPERVQRLTEALRGQAREVQRLESAMGAAQESASRFAAAERELEAQAHSAAQALEGQRSVIRQLENNVREHDAAATRAHGAARQRAAEQEAWMRRFSAMLAEGEADAREAAFNRARAEARALELMMAAGETALQTFEIQRNERRAQESRDATFALQEEIQRQQASLEAFRGYVAARTNASSDESARLREELLGRETALQAHVTSLAEISSSSDRVTAQSARDRVEANALANQSILENTLETERRARAQRQELAEISVGMVEDGVKALGKAFVAIAKGEKSAEEAFRGLLASFLEFLGQMAGLQAAKEYALAIGDFASQNYSGGAMHLAAGVAWTVVAVAAGAGAAAVAPAAASAPATPESSRDAGGGGGGGGTTIVQFNGNVLTAGTHAEVGRVVTDAIDAKRRRFG